MKSIKHLFIATFVCSFLLLGTNEAKSQNADNVVTFSAGLINKLRVKYEKPLSYNFSVGGFLNGYYGVIPGVKVDPFIRLYFGGEAPEGFYIQAKGTVGRFKSAQTLIDRRDGQEVRPAFISYGGGLNLGVQFLLGRRDQLALDIGIGVKLVSPVPEFDVEDPNLYYDEFFEGVDNAVFYTTGPGSLFDGLFAVGFTF